MQGSINTTQVNLDGLLEVLGKNLYSTPFVALRELIQNAHDACERHRIETGAADTYRIELESDTEQGTLVIRDNGSGLTAEEIREYLATIGSGYTRELRNADNNTTMIGYFGLGFLSAYVVADKVDVYTCSYQTPDQAWSFSTTGGKAYALAPASVRPRGTEVHLQLGADYRHLADADVLHSLLQRYCCLLPLDIHLNGSPSPVNALRAPWQQSLSHQRKKQSEFEFARFFEADFQPLATISIPADNPYGLKGLIWLQDGGSYASSDNRNVSVFVRSMFITHHEEDLIPRWAGFCGAVLESAHFVPTASRESLQQDSYYAQVTDYLHELLVTSLRDIILREPDTWRRIASRHNQALLGAAIADDRLFEVLRNRLLLPTTDGEKTLPQVLRQSGGTLYIKPDMQTGHEEVLFSARGIPLVSGYLYAAHSFCRKYAEFENLHIHLLGSHSDTSDLFKPAGADNSQTALLQQVFSDQQTDVLLTRFEPAFIPLLEVPDQDALLKQRLEQDEADKRIGAAALKLARMHTDTIENRKPRKRYINLSNPVIAALPSLNEPQRNHVCTLLRGLMSGLAREQHEQNPLDQMLAAYNEALLALCEYKPVKDEH